MSQGSPVIPRRCLERWGFSIRDRVELCVRLPRQRCSQEGQSLQTRLSWSGTSYRILGHCRVFLISTCALHWGPKFLSIYFSFCNISSVIRSNYATPLSLQSPLLTTKWPNLLIWQHLVVWKKPSAPWLINCSTHCTPWTTTVPSLLGRWLSLCALNVGSNGTRFSIRVLVSWGHSWHCVKLN